MANCDLFIVLNIPGFRDTLIYRAYHSLTYANVPHHNRFSESYPAQVSISTTVIRDDHSDDHSTLPLDVQETMGTLPLFTAKRLEQTSPASKKQLARGWLQHVQLLRRSLSKRLGKQLRVLVFQLKEKWAALE